MPLNLDKCIEQLRNKEILSEGTIKEVCTTIKKLLINESNVNQVSSPVTIVGDLLGQYYDLLEMFKVAGEIPNTNYLFLGNYINRGFYSVETISLLCCYKLKYPNRVTLLRGNNESRPMTQLYGFYGECMRKYGSANVWRYFIDMFDYLSVSATIDNVYFAVHSGISSSLVTLDQVRLLDRFTEVPADGPMTDLLWSSPSAAVQGFGPSRRGPGKTFGFDAFKKFMQVNKLTHFVRSNDLCLDGFSIQFDDALTTIWSAPNFVYRCNNLACVLEFLDNSQRHYNIYMAAPETERYRPATDPTKDIPDYYM